MTNDDPVYRPFHYTKGGIECIDAMIEAFGMKDVRAYCRLNAFKYLWRSELKGNGMRSPTQDLEKAIWYLKFAIGEDPRAETREEEITRKTH